MDFLNKGVSTIIGNGQLFEKANTISKKEVDIYVTDIDGEESLADEGVVVLNLRDKKSYGFEGVESLTGIFEKGKRLVELVKVNEKNSPYTAAWKKRSGNWYVKQEVS